MQRKANKRVRAPRTLNPVRGSVVTPSLLFGRVLCSRMRCSVMQSVMLLMSSPCGFQHCPVSRLKAVQRSLSGLLIPPPNCPRGCRLPLNKRNCLWCQENRAVVRSAKWGKGTGTGCAPCICIKADCCSTVSGGPVYKLVESWSSGTWLQSPGSRNGRIPTHSSSMSGLPKHSFTYVLHVLGYTTCHWQTAQPTTFFLPLLCITPSIYIAQQRWSPGNTGELSWTDKGPLAPPSIKISDVASWSPAQN